MSMELLDARFGVSPKAFAFPHTDSGVEESFFTEVFAEPLLDISFGTAGLVSHFHPRNIERVSMEKTSAPAADILARQFARATYFRVRRRWGPAAALRGHDQLLLRQCLTCVVKILEGQVGRQPT